MRCTILQDAEGTRVIVCGPRRQPQPRCFVCQRPGATHLCDGPPQPGSRLSTCSRALHTLCSSGRLVVQDLDFCPPCWRARNPDTWWKPKARTGELFEQPPSQYRGGRR